MRPLIQNVKIAQAYAPDADIYESGPNSTDVLSFESYKSVTWVINEGVGTTGTAVITVDSCDNFTPSNTTAIAFRYKVITTQDTEGALTAAAAAGFTTTAGSNHCYLITVDASELDGTDSFVRMTMTEAVDAVVIAGVVSILSEPRYGGDSMPTAIA